MTSLTPVVAVIGLGYVGLPQVVEFGKRVRTIGFDIAENKVAACQRGTDPSRELPDAALAAATQAVYTADGALLAEADIIMQHSEYAALSVADIGRKLVPGGAAIDVKATFDAAALQGAGYSVWRL